MKGTSVICMLCIFISIGRGGASIYGKEFDDEISNELKHTGRCLFSINHKYICW